MSPRAHPLDHDDEDQPYDPYTALPPAEPYVPDDYDDRPTRKQLAYLRSLAQRTGQTFAWPKTRRQASAEINRLKHAQPSTRVERRVKRKLIADQIAAGPLDSARVREDEEISGYGSSATWTQNREPDPPPVKDPRGSPPPTVGARPWWASAPSSPATGSRKVRGSFMASGWTGASE